MCAGLYFRRIHNLERPIRRTGADALQRETRDRNDSGVYRWCCITPERALRHRVDHDYRRATDLWGDTRKMILRIAGGVIGGLLALPIRWWSRPGSSRSRRTWLVLRRLVRRCLRGSEQRSASVAGQQAGISFVGIYGSESQRRLL